MERVPHWLCRQLQDSDLDRIEAAVAEAEKYTSAEIVPMIVQRSTRPRQTAALIFLLGLLITTEFAAWMEAWTLTPLWVWEVVGIGLSLVAAYMGPHFAAVEAALTWRRDRRHEVETRAELEFYRSNIKATAASTGVLLFVSLFERQAVILADLAVAEKFPPETWNQLLNRLLSRAQAGELGAGMVEAIGQLGDLLKTKFPIRADDKNEISNQLIVKE